MSLRAGLPDVEPKTKSGTSGKRTCRRSVRPSQVTCWNMRHVKTCCGFVVAPRHTGEIDVYCVCVSSGSERTERDVTDRMWSAGQRYFHLPILIQL